MSKETPDTGADVGVVNALAGGSVCCTHRGALGWGGLLPEWLLNGAVVHLYRNTRGEV